MGVLLIGTAVGFYEYSNDEGNYFVIEKPNIPIEIFNEYSAVIEQIFYFDDETHIQTLQQDEWNGNLNDYYNMKQGLQDLAEALDIQGNLETSLGTATYLCLNNDNGERVGCFVRDYGTLQLFVCEEGIIECE